MSGHSTGALLASELADSLPKGLILKTIVVAPAFPGFASTLQAKLYSLPANNHEFAAKAAFIFREIFPNQTSELISHRVGGHKFGIDAVNQNFSPGVVQNAFLVLKGMLEHTQDPNFLSLLKRMGSRLEIFFCNHDTWIDSQVKSLMSENLSEAELHTLPNAYHDFVFRDSQNVAGVLAQSVQKVIFNSRGIHSRWSRESFSKNHHIKDQVKP